jgi:hypothetical protein
MPKLLALTLAVALAQASPPSGKYCGSAMGVTLGSATIANASKVHL